MDKQTILINQATACKDWKGAWDLVNPILASGKTVKVDIYPNQIGKWTMTRLWRSWMGSTAKFMADNGCTMPLMIKKDGTHYGKRPFNPEDAHELFTSQWLGHDENGSRLSWAKQGDNIATKGQRFIAMIKHEEWMVNKGIKYLIPANSEYFTEKQKTES